MLTRRHALALPLAALVPGPAMPQALSRPKLGEDGLHQFDWYLESFLDIREDIAAARTNEKRLVVMWGLRGCPACKRLHEVHLMDAPVQTYVRTHFEVLHLNILGSREVTGLNGRRLPEKAFAEAEGVRSTPTLQFMPDTPDGTAEVARLDRLPEVPAFLAYLRYIREKGYEREGFDAWLRQQA